MSRELRPMKRSELTKHQRVTKDGIVEEQMCNFNREGGCPHDADDGFPCTKCNYYDWIEVGYLVNH